MGGGRWGGGDSSKKLLPDSPPVRYIPHGNAHEINTYKCPSQTQCGYIVALC